MAEECIFCTIVSGKIPSIKIYEDEKHLAFLDINPRNPGHTLVIPKKHYEVILDMPEAEAGKLFEIVKKMSVNVKNGTKAEGISVVQNNYKIAGQVVPHVHFHVIPRFGSEGPAALEALLSVKKMPEEVMKKIGETIRSADQSSTTPQPQQTGHQPTKKKDVFEF